MTVPYYEDEHVTLYHGDCLEVDAWLAADVLVTDPPYGAGYFSEWRVDATGKRIRGAEGRRRNGVRGDDDTTTRDEALYRWGERPALVFGRWDVPRPKQTHTRLIWDKGASAGMGNLTIPWGRSDEEIYVLGQGFKGRREGSIVRVQMLGPTDHERPDHPTPKPVPLLERLIEKCPLDVITDPFAGSGSTLMAARNLGRSCIGVEIEERYCELIAKRLAQGAFDFGEAS